MPNSPEIEIDTIEEHFISRNAPPQIAVKVEVEIVDVIDLIRMYQNYIGCFHTFVLLRGRRPILLVATRRKMSRFDVLFFISAESEPKRLHH